MVDTLKHREGSANNLDFTCKQDVGGSPVEYAIDDKLVRVVIADSNGVPRRIYSSDPNDEAEGYIFVGGSRVEIEPDDGEGAQTGLVRIHPTYDTFRPALSPYQVFIWVYLSGTDKIGFPSDNPYFEVEVDSANGTYDL